MKPKPTQPPAKTSTPETDAAEFFVATTAKQSPDEGGMFVEANFARRLEKERDAARAELGHYRAGYQDVVDLSEHLRQQLEEARSTNRKVIKALGWKSDDMGIAPWEKIELLIAQLTALQARVSAGEADSRRLNLPWSVESVNNPDAEYSGGGPEAHKGFDAFQIVDSKGRVLFDSLNRDPAASLIKEDVSEESVHAWDKDAKRDALTIVKVLNAMRPPTAEQGGEKKL